MIDNESSIKLYQSIGSANEERTYHHWHASSIATCPRTHYFERLGVPHLRKPTAAKVIRWGAGHKLEEELRTHISSVWGETISNVRLTSDKWDLTGEYDNLTLDGTRLVEVKSVHDRAFGYGKEATLKDNQPYLHHVLQNHAYVLLLAEEGTVVTHIDFVYVSLSGRLCVYKTEVNSKYLEWVKARLTMLNEAWRDKIPPICICTQDESPLFGGVYQWCDYRSDEAQKPPTKIADPNCCSIDLIKEKINGK